MGGNPWRTRTTLAVATFAGALIAGLLTGGLPYDLAGWRARVAFALQVAGMVCESPGGAVAMPTREQVEHRFAAPPV